MNDIATTHGSDRDASRERLLSQPTTTETPALITEQQVLLSTAAAVALPPAKTRRWYENVHAAASAVGSWVASAAKPPTKPVYPKRHVWLENASMGREMDRL
jgi:hypothetical protein